MSAPNLSRVCFDALAGRGDERPARESPAAYADAVAGDLPGARLEAARQATLRWALPAAERFYALDHAPVPLEDDALAIADAERRLAEKEIAAAYPPLRSRFGAAPKAFLHAVRMWRAHGLDAGPEATAATPTLRTLLVETRGISDGALDVLRVLGKTPLERDAMSAARGLDLPDVTGFYDDDNALTLGRALREVLHARPDAVRRVRMPRAVAGQVFIVDDEVTRVAVAHALRAERFLALVFGHAQALTVGTAPPEDRDRLAAARGLGLLDPRVLQRVLERERKDADRAARVLIATTLLTLRVRIAALLALIEGGDSDESIRDAIMTDVGLDLGTAPSVRLPAPWPQGDGAAAPLDVGVRSVLALAAAATDAAFARQVHDEDWVLRAHELPMEAALTTNGSALASGCATWFGAFL